MFSKAFDKVYRKGLLWKVFEAGITGNLFFWIKEFLTDRTQRVVYKSAKSRACFINSGVPQGSVLGPLLFLIFMNDLGDNLESDLKLFADDSQLAQSNKPETEQLEIIDRDLKKLESWGKMNKTEFSAKKTVHMRIVCKN